jgi:hypothetical protein
VDFVVYVERWRQFAERLARTDDVESASEIGRGYSAEELREMEHDLAARFRVPGFVLPQPLRELIGAALSLRVQWVVRSPTTVSGSVWLTPQDVFETEEECAVDRIDFWGTERVLERISDSESVTAVFAGPHTTNPALYFRDGDRRWPLGLTVTEYLAYAWRHRGRYGWQRVLVTGGDLYAFVAAGLPPQID